MFEAAANAAFMERTPFAIDDARDDEEESDDESEGVVDDVLDEVRFAVLMILQLLTTNNRSMPSWKRMTHA